MKAKVRIELPRKLSVTKETKEEIDRNLMIKKLKKYGFFDKDGKWKEN